jgi:hypothetical protein
VFFLMEMEACCVSGWLGSILFCCLTSNRGVSGFFFFFFFFLRKRSRLVVQKFRLVRDPARHEGVSLWRWRFLRCRAPVSRRRLACLWFFFYTLLILYSLKITVTSPRRIFLIRF